MVFCETTYSYMLLPLYYVPTKEVLLAILVTVLKTHCLLLISFVARDFNFESHGPIFNSISKKN